MTKISPSIGLSFSPIKNFAIDASVLYVAGTGRDGSIKYTDLLLSQVKGQPVVQTFSAHYGVHAVSPSVGLHLMF